MKSTMHRYSKSSKTHKKLKTPNLSQKGPIALRSIASRILTTILILVERTFQQCTITETKEQGTIRMRKLAANNTLLTVDHWSVYRVLSLDSIEVLYKLDLNPFFSQIGASEPYIKGGFFKSDTEIHLITDNNYYRFDMVTDTMTKLSYPAGLGENIRGNAFQDVRTNTRNFFGFKINKYQCVFTEENTKLSVWTPGSPLGKITGVQTPSIWPQSRVYGTLYPNKIGYFGFDGTSFGNSAITETGWDNVTSNIAIKEAQDLIAYGLNKTEFEGGVRFRKLDLTDRFVKNLDHPFLQCQFHPNLDVLVAYFIEGELCLIGYDLGANTINIDGCYPIAAPEFEIEFMNGKMVLFRESMIAVYNFPSVSLSFVYSPQPIYTNQIVGSINQLHIFPGIKVRNFNTEEMRYSHVSLYRGNVLKAYVNPHNINEMFLLEDLRKVKKIRISDGNLLATYDPYGQISTNFNSIYRNCKLLGFDLYKNNNQILISLYRCYKIIDNSRKNLIIEYNYFLNTVNYFEYTASNDYLNQIRTGFFGSDDIFIIGGARCVYYLKPTYNPFGFTQFGETCTKQFALERNLEMVDSSGLFVGMSNFITFPFSISDETFLTKQLMLGGVGDFTNCLPELSATDTSVTPNIPPGLHCGGSTFLKGDGFSHNNWGYVILIKNEITGAMFKRSDGEIYIQQNEGTRIKYTGKKMSCYKNDISDEVILMKFGCGDPNCLECQIENGYYCRKCVNPYFVFEGNCVTSCPAGYYRLNDQCFEHCPLDYFKLEGSLSTCILDCSSDSTDIYTFGDRCTSSCPFGSILSGNKCICSAGKLAKEDLTCVAASGSNCPNGEFYWHHYEMCLSNIRNSTSNPSPYSVYSGNNIYCDAGNFVDFDNGLKCIPYSQCVSPRLTGYHPDYGNICVTPSQCKTTLNYNVDTPNLKCFSICPNFVEKSTQECYYKCPSGTVHFPPTYECLPNCPSTPTPYYETTTGYCRSKSECTGYDELYASVNDFKCIKPCGPQNPLLVPSTQECHSACPSLTYHLASNSSCETAEACKAVTIPSQHYTTFSSQSCSTSCPVGLYKYEGDFSCLTAGECQSMVDGYTKNDTMECVSKQTCTSASRLLIPSFKDCGISCPLGTYHSISDSSCLTQIECQSQNYYTNNETRECLNSCQIPKFSDERIKDCVNFCPLDLLMESRKNQCLTESQCATLGVDSWINLSTMTCDNICLKKKEENTKKCLDQCPGGLYDGSVCFSQTEVEIIQGKRLNQTEEVEIIMEFRDSIGNLDKKIIEKLEVKNLGDNQTEIINEFSFEQMNDKELKIKFQTIYYKDKIENSFTFNKNLLIKSKNKIPYSKKNYYILTKELKKTLDNIIENGNQTQVGRSVKILVSIHLLIIKILPLLIPIRSSSMSASNLLKNLAQTFNKLIIYSFFSFKMTEDVDNFYLDIFHDLCDCISEFLVNKAKTGTSQKDLEYTCENKSWRFCHVEITVGFLTSQMTTFLLFILLCILLGLFSLLGIKWGKFKKVIVNLKVGSLPNFWIGNQLEIIFAIILNITSPLFESWIFLLSYILSILLLLGFLYVAFSLIVMKKWENSKYYNLVLTENFEKIIKSVDSSKFWMKINFVMDAILTLSIILFQNNPFTQALIWLIFNIVFCYFILRKVKFKKSIFNLRMALVEISFVVLSLLIFIASLKKKEDLGVSWGIFGLSCFILVTDMLFSFGITVLEIIGWCKQKLFS